MLDYGLDKRRESDHDASTMPAPKGNRFWEARSSHGRKPIFATPEQLEAACDEYFEWAADNPLIEIKPFAYEGVVSFEDVPKMRAMTIDGLTDFLDIDPQTWANYRAKEDFFGVVTRAERIIRRQKFEGASAGFLNANIIARDLGLADKTELAAGIKVVAVSEVDESI